MNNKKRKEGGALFKKPTTVFQRLFLTYSLAIVAATLFTAAVSAMLYSASFQREVETVHRRMLTHTAETLDYKIITPATNMMMEICKQFNENGDELYAFEQQANNKLSSFLNSLDYLKRTSVSRGDAIRAVSVYYRQEKILLSTFSGVRYLDGNGLLQRSDVPWIEMMEDLNKSQAWLYNNPDPILLQQNPSILYCHTYPILSSAKDSLGLIAVEIDERTCRDIITQSATQQGVDTFLVDNHGVVISASDPTFLRQVLPENEMLRQSILDDSTYGQLTVRTDQGRFIISHVQVPHSDWRLVHKIPVEKFYQASRRINISLGLLCLLFIFSGIAASYLVAHRVYNPLKVIVGRVRGMMMEHPGKSEESGNDYRVINEAISRLSKHVGDLELALQADFPIIKYNFFTSLINGQALSEAVLEERLEQIGIAPDMNAFCVLLFQFCQKDLQGLTQGNKQYMKYSLLQEIERMRDADTFLYGMETADTFSIVVILGSKHQKEAPLQDISTHLLRYVSSNFFLRTYIGVGSWADEAEGLRDSYLCAQTLCRYRWYLPGMDILRDPLLLKREENTERLPAKLSENFRQAIRQRNTRQTRATIEEFCRTLMQGPYSDRACQEFLIVILHIFTVFLKETRYKTTPQEKEAFSRYLVSAADIAEFREWLLSWVERVVETPETPAENRNSELIRQVQEYILAHLSEELSLEILAEFARISPRYLSRLFKSETGVNFTVFINDNRLSYAEALLRETDLTVQEITYKTGYHTPAYFIQQFTQKYGATPYNYRRNLPHTL